VRGTAQEVLQHFMDNEPRGEFVIIIGGATGSSEGADNADETDSFSEKDNPHNREKHESKYQRKLRQRNNEE
jgi:16S rRNA C1402 (ribose-2'-O) methylase RsmI